MFGSRTPRVEDARFVRGAGVYVAGVRDARLAGAGWVTYVRSDVAHGRISGIDASAARRLPGVIAVVTAEDIPLAPAPPEIGMLDQRMTRPWLARDVVRFAGEPVAAVVSGTRERGADAAALVRTRIEKLPSMVDVGEAVKDEVLLFPEAGTNTALALGGEGGPDDLFDGCPVVVTRDLVNPRVAAVPLETRAAACAWHADGGPIFWAACQGAHHARGLLAAALGVEAESVRVIVPDVGGAFGARIGLSAEEVLVAELSRRHGLPLRWEETRTESLLAMGHGRGQRQRVTIGGDRDGTVRAYRLEIVQDAGAYPRLGALLPLETRRMAPGPYRIARVGSRAVSVVTNTAPVMSYRGAGQPEAAAALERAMDLFAAEIGMDPVAVRRRNLIPPDAFPYTTATGITYDSGDPPGALERVLRAAGHAGLRAEQSRRRAARDPVALGIGVALYVKASGEGADGARVEVFADGTAAVRAGTCPQGQGHETAWAMLVGDRLGIPITSVRFVGGDTAAVPRGRTTSGSESLQVCGTAVWDAAGALAGRARRLAAEALGAPLRDVRLDREVPGFRAAASGDGAGDSRVISWGRLAEQAAGSGGLHATGRYAGGGTTSSGAHLAVVEVDIETGRAVVIRLVTVDDAGRLLNPRLVEGQRLGGAAQGIGQALYENAGHGDDGVPLALTLGDYGVPYASDLPEIDLLAMETPAPGHPLGIKGAGEIAVLGAAPAVQNAVVDALAHLGVRHVDMPLLPERVWRAISASPSYAGGAVR